jgi:hypothetical protein
VRYLMPSGHPPYSSEAAWPEDGARAGGSPQLRLRPAVMIEPVRPELVVPALERARRQAAVTDGAVT